jgi:protein gp37
MTTTIEWTEATWNPTTGCDQVSPGCDHCYALTLAKRLKGMGSAKYQRDGDPRTSGPGFGITEHPDALDVPLRWRKPRRVFVNSMSDLFHDGISDEFIERVFASMAMARQHTYQVLTKRHGRMRSLLNSPTFQRDVRLRVEHHDEVYTRTIANWPLPNVWLGVTVENQKWAGIRIPALLDTPAAVRFLSCEPLLGPLSLYEHLQLKPVYNPEPGIDIGFTGVEWVICGGESGPGARSMSLSWARTIVTQCQDAGVPVFVKQLGSRWAAEHGGGKGGDISQWPADLRVREYPGAA